MMNATSIQAHNSTYLHVQQTTVTRWIWGVYGILLLGFGTVGNVLSILVLKRPLLWHMPLTMYLMALAVVDLLVLWTGLFNWWLFTTFDIRSIYIRVEVCHMLLFLVYLFPYLSAAIVTAISVQRFISIVFPLRAKVWNSRRNILISLIVMTIVLIPLAIPVILPCTADYTPVLGNVIVWTDFTVRFFLPFLIILISSAVMIVRLRASSRFRMEHVASDETRVQRTERKVTIMLVTLCLLYVLCVLPQAALFLFKKPDNSEFLLDCVHALMYLNNATTFIVYFFAAPNFRKELQRMFTTKS